MVLVNPRKFLLTKDVFKNNTRINTAPIVIPEKLSFIRDDDEYGLSKNLLEFLTPLRNDLTESAIQLMPEIKIILNLLQSQRGCSLSRMSGSGPTCFGIFSDSASAMEAKKAIKATYPDYWVKYTGA